MSTKFNLKFRQIIAPLGILFLSGLVTVIWFRKGLMFAGGEEGLPLYNPSKYLELISHIWYDANGGYPVALLLPRIPYAWVLMVLYKLGIGPVFLQALSFFVLILTGCLSVFYLTKETIGEKLKGKLNNLVPLLASIFYFFNPFSMVQIWGRGIYAQFFAFALVPLFLLFYILAIKRRNFVYLILSIIASLVFSSAFVFPTQILVLWIPIFTYSIFHIWINRKHKKEVLFTLGLLTFLGVFWFFTQFWWICPYLKTLRENVSRLGDLDYNLGSLRGISRESSLVVVSRLTHKFLLVGTCGNVYLSLPFKLLSWLIPLVSIFSLRVFRKLKSFGFYIVLFLISLFMVLGSNMPMGWLFVWLFERVPVFRGFRNPYEKAGILLMISYIPFFVIGVLEVSNRLCKFLKIKSRNVFVLIIMFLICGLYVWPMWTGQFAGGIKINPWVEVPTYYKEADDWLRNQDRNTRIIQLPLNPGDGVRTKWDYPYQGIEPSEFLFMNSSIGRNVGVNKTYYNVLLERFGVLQKYAFGPDPDISKSEFRAKNLYEELAKLNVRFIVLHRDLDEKLSGMKTAEETAQYLTKEKNIEKVKTFGQLDIYEVLVPENIAHIYSPNTRVNYEKINPSLYKFSVENAGKPFDLIFLEMYDPDWELFVDSQRMGNHSTAFSYANVWALDKKGTYSGYIKYKLQNYVEEGSKISVITTTGLVIITITMIIKMFLWFKIT